jgi:translation initiation factor 2B subunit (eIF-2B alpha/beta/delta family)
MSAVDQIIMAEEKVAEFQSQLATVESVLEKAEQVAVTGEKAGRCLRRSFRVLLAISIVAAIALIVKKVMAGRSPGGAHRTEDHLPPANSRHRRPCTARLHRLLRSAPEEGAGTAHEQLPTVL